MEFLASEICLVGMSMHHGNNGQWN